LAALQCEILRMDGSPLLGRLEPVALRTVWAREDHRFTPWLAQPENLRLLGTTLGLELELQATEQSIGPFCADIVCREAREDRLVLIENQLERTDHTHLGQLITYTAGLATATIVWVAAEFTEEHRAALDWLNSATDDHFRFFGLEVQVWRIGDSMKAPAFRIVSQPNDWMKRTHEIARAVERGEMSELGRQRSAYWRGFRQYLNARPSPVELDRDYASGYVAFQISESPFVLVAYRSVQGPGVFVRVRAEDLEQVRDALQPLRSEIERISGGSLIGPDADPTNGGWLRSAALRADPTDESDWPRQLAWMADTLERYRAALEYARCELRKTDRAAA
jgi:hypothetical protein